MLLEEYKEWLTHPVTEVWFKFLDKTRESIKEEWANSIYTGAGNDETLQRNAAAIGQANLIKLLTDAAFEDIVETVDERIRD